MSTLITYKYQLYKAKQNKHLHRQINIAGCSYNHCIAVHKRYYRLYGKSLNTYHLKKQVTKLKKQAKYAFWNQLGSQASQDVVLSIDKAYQLCYRNLKAGLKTAPPSFKKVKKYKRFTLTQAGWGVCGNALRIGKRIYKFSFSRNLDGNVKTVTIKRNALAELFVFFALELTGYPQSGRVTRPESDVKLMSCKAALNMMYLNSGFDFGLRTFLTSSDEGSIYSPLYLKQAQKQLLHLQKRFARTKKGSSNHRSLKRQLASLHETIVNKRRDWFYKLAHELTDAYDYVFFETLNLKARQRLWGSKVSDLALHNFLQLLDIVAKTKGKLVTTIDRWFPSTKLCACGHKNNNLRLAARRWRCPSCQRVNDRDKNAAKNILAEGHFRFAEVV